MEGGGTSLTETAFEVTATFAEDQTLIGRGISRTEAVGNLILEHGFGLGIRVETLAPPRMIWGDRVTVA